MTIRDPQLLLRDFVPRLLAALGVFVCACFVAGGIKTMERLEVQGAVMAVVGGLGVAASVAVFVAELRHRLWIGADGMASESLGIRGLRRTEVLFRDVVDLRLTITKKETHPSGLEFGVVGVVVAVAVRAASDPGPDALNARTHNVDVMLTTSRATLSFGRHDIGAVDAYNAVIALTPHRRTTIEKQVERGGAALGPVLLKKATVAIGSVVFDRNDVETSLTGSKLVLSSSSGLRASVRQSDVPNLDVLREMLDEEVET